MSSQLRLNTKSFQFARNRRWVQSGLVRWVLGEVWERRPAQSFRPGRRIAASQEVSRMFWIGHVIQGVQFPRGELPQTVIFGILTPCSLVCGHWRVGGSYCVYFLLRQVQYLTAWSRILLVKPRCSQLVWKFLLRGTRQFIVVCTQSVPFFQSQLNPLHILLSYFFKILFNNSLSNTKICTIC